MNPQPKPLPLAVARAKRKGQDERKASAMRDAVWARDRNTCRLCYRTVLRGSAFWRGGEVHHLRGRRVDLDIYDPEKAVLLCVDCHRAVTDKRIKVTGTTSETFRVVEKTRGQAL